MGAAALLLAFSAFLSRIMGLVRDKIISWQFGATEEADLYFAAFVVPDIINYLLAGGFMSITLIPILSRRFQDDPADAWRFFSCVLFWIFCASALLTLIGEICAPALAKLTAPGFSPLQTQRLAHFMRIILPGQVFFLTGACFTALLFLRREFAVPALSPLVYNGCIILFGLTLPFVAGPDFGMSGYCIGVAIGAFLGAFILPVFAVLKGELHLHKVWCHPLLKRFFIIALPLMLGQTVIMLDEQFLRVFGSMLDEGSVSLLNYARRIAQLPVSLLGQAIAVASYPFLVKLLAEHKNEEFNQTLNRAMSYGVALVIPCAAAMIALSGPILGAIFEGGRFTSYETAACRPLAMIMLAIAPAWLVYMILSRAFYALEDSLTPALTGTLVTILAIPCYYFLAVPPGEWAIAAVSSISITAYLFWLIMIWRKRHTGAAFHGLGLLLLRGIAICILPGLAAWGVSTTLPPELFSLPVFLAHLLRLCLGGLTFAAIFLLLAKFFWPQFMDTFLPFLTAKFRQH